MKSKIILVIVLCFFTATCTTLSDKKREIVEIDILKGYQNVRDFKLSEIVSDVSYVKLETLPNAHFSLGIPIIHNQYILIKAVRENRLILFDSSGKFIRIIGRQGKGPGEFLGFQDVYFHPKDPKILVHDENSKKILVYSIEGKYLDEFNYSTHYKRAFQKVFFNRECDIQVVLGRPDQQVVDFPLVRILDSTFQEKKQYHYITNESIAKGNRTGFSNYWIDNGELFLQEFYYDTVYRHHEDGLSALFKINLGENHTPTFYIANNPGVWVYNSILYLRSIGDYFLLYAHLPKLGEERIPLVYNIKSNQLFRPKKPKTKFLSNEDLQGINNDIDGFGEVIIVDTWEGKIAEVLNIIDLQEAIEKEQLEFDITHPEKREQLIEMFRNMDPEDNPIVRIFTVK